VYHHCSSNRGHRRPVSKCENQAEALRETNSYKIFLDSTWLAWFAGGMRIEGPATEVLVRERSNILDHVKI